LCGIFWKLVKLGVIITLDVYIISNLAYFTQLREVKTDPLTFLLNEIFSKKIIESVSIWNIINLGIAVLSILFSVISLIFTLVGIFTTLFKKKKILKEDENSKEMEIPHKVAVHNPSSDTNTRKSTAPIFRPV
jgi:hypothetical protein